MTTLDQRLQQIAEENGYSWPAGEIAAAMRMAYRAALECQWQPIETIPVNILVDVWIKSNQNQRYGRRQVEVCKSSVHSSGWTGLQLAEYEYVSHWMRIPRRPGEEQEHPNERD